MTSLVPPQITPSDASVDIHVGSRIKSRRLLMGYSQERLAKEIGVTFQQIQKYERGLNRVHASKLWKIAKILGVSVNFFFDEMEPENFFAIHNAQSFCFSEETPVMAEKIFDRKDVLELVRHYLSISNPKVAKNVLNLVKSLALEQIDSSEDTPQ